MQSFRDETGQKCSGSFLFPVASWGLATLLSLLLWAIPLCCNKFPSLANANTNWFLLQWKSPTTTGLMKIASRTIKAYTLNTPWHEISTLFPNESENALRGGKNKTLLLSSIFRDYLGTRSTPFWKKEKDTILTGRNERQWWKAHDQAGPRWASRREEEIWPILCQRWLLRQSQRQSRWSQSLPSASPSPNQPKAGRGLWTGPGFLIG